MGILLCLDLGTEGVRAAAFDETGTPLGTTHRPYPTSYPAPGRAEQDPRDWWRSLVDATRELLALDTCRAAGPVVAIAPSTTSSTVVAADENGQPLRPAILWMDARAGAQSAATAALADRHEVLAFSGGSDAAEWLLPKAMWLAENEPEIYARSQRVVEAIDYITHALVGRWVGSQMTAVCKYNYDALSGRFPASLYADLGVADLVDRLPDEILPVGAAAGALIGDAADELSIDGSPVVGVGGIDAHVSLLACGPRTSGVVTVVAGTSTALITEHSRPAYNPEFWGPYPHALHGDRWLFEAGQVCSGAVLSWLAETAFETDRSDLEPLLVRAGAMAPGSHGLLALDFFMGNRTPYRDPRLRGAFLGITLGTGRADLYRAAVEAIACGNRNALESFTRAGLPTERLVLSGGIAKNALWRQVTVDVLGRPVELVEDHNMTLRACATIAAAASGHAHDLDEAATLFTPPTRTLEPTAGRTGAYDAIYERYRRAAESLAPMLRELASSTDVEQG